MHDGEVARPRLLARREFLKAGAAAGGATFAAVGLPPSIKRALATAPAGATLSDVEHVVILIQENRSFDHYFGRLSGVRGFSDPNALVQPDGNSVFQQPDPDVAANPAGYVFPFRLDNATTSGQCVHDLSHAWSVGHYSWNQGQMDGFVSSHRVADDGFGAITPPPTNYGPLTMSYYDRADIPFHYALADAFTVCDGYHCSVFGPTNPNRLYSMTGTIDPNGTNGGPCIDNSQNNGQLSWTTYPERLQAAGISWYVYQEADNDTNNVLPLFAQYQDTTTEIYRRGNTIIPTPAGQPYGPALAEALKQDVLNGTLPQVSWLLASTPECEHPSAAPNAGAQFISRILDALTADPAVWAKTVLFVTYDENDGFFDHIVPPTAPPGTADEYINAQWAAQNPSASFGFTGPIGLGFRVPMLVVSPFTRGGLCCTGTFDHTSLLRFLEARFGVEVPNLSAWRRSVTGDLTAAFNFAAAPDATIPSLPDAAALAAAAATQCSSLPAPGIPANQTAPSQESGPARPQPSGPVTPGSPVPDVPWVPALLAAGSSVAAAAWLRRGSKEIEPSGRGPA